MLTTEDLSEIKVYIDRKMEKTLSKIQNERNAKIVNYKIRAFIENVRDKLKRFEPVSLVDHGQTIVNKASQLDRIEMTIGQVLNTVQKVVVNSNADTPYLNNGGDNASLSNLTPVETEGDVDQAPSRQRSGERNSKYT